MAIAGLLLSASPALASWRAGTAATASIAYNNGVTFDRARGNFFFDGVSSTTNSGLYRTDSRLVQTAANGAVIPPTPEGYNHTGDLSFDPRRRRILLPLECYYPSLGGNTCGIGAIGVADPVTLRFLYYVNLDTTQIKKAMWAEVSPDGRWIWTSSGTHLLVYRAADVNLDTANRQRSGTIGGIVGTDLGAVLPTGSVTGATFYEDALTRGLRLLLALNRGASSEVVSFPASTGLGPPRLLRTSPVTEITLAQSLLDNESEGLATSGAGKLSWLMLPAITGSTIFSRILGYRSVPSPPGDGARVQPGQWLQPALSRGLRLTVVCNQRCSSAAVATIGGGLARRLGLTRSRSTSRYPVGRGRLGAGSGIRTLRIAFGPRTRRALQRLPGVKLLIAGRSTDASTRLASSYKVATTLRRY